MSQQNRRISRKRRNIWTVALIVAGLLSWWVQIYDPLSEQMAEQKTAIGKNRQEIDRLAQRIERLSVYAEPPSTLLEALREKRKQMIPGRKLEEVNPGIQTAMQDVADRAGVSIKSYKDLPAGQWKDYGLARIELQIETSTENLSRYLESLDALQKLVRIEKMTISYRKAKGFDLVVTMQVAALFLED